MGDVAVRGLTEADALEKARHGSCATVEVRGRLTSARILADLIAGFAHREGGFIIFGFRKGKVVGCNQNRVKRRHDQAEAFLGNSQISTLYFHKVHGRQLGVVYVPALDRLICSPRGIVVRDNNVLRAMSRAQIREAVQRMQTKLSVEDFGTLITTISSIVANLNANVENGQKTSTKIKDHILGFLIGSALTAVVAFVASRLR